MNEIALNHPDRHTFPAPGVQTLGVLKRRRGVYMIKITPVKGPAYYYLDEDGDGQLELRESDRKLNPVRPVYWKIKEW